MRTPDDYRDDYPYTLADARAEAREMAGDLMADLIDLTDDEFDALFAPDFDDQFAPEDGNTDDILIDTEQIGRPISNACRGCGAEVADGTWLGDSDVLCDECYGDLWEPPSCPICDGWHGTRCPIENYEYNDGTDGIWN